MKIAFLTHAANPNRTFEPEYLPWQVNEVEDDLFYVDDLPWAYMTKEEFGDYCRQSLVPLMNEVAAKKVFYDKEVAVLKLRRIIRDARVWGQDFVEEFGARNVVEGRSRAEMNALFQKLKDIQLLIMSGSLGLVLDHIDDLQTDLAFTEEMRTLWKTKITEFWT